MKDSKTNLAISQKTKVASSLNNSISSLTPIGRNLSTSKFGNNTENNQQNNLNNSDDEFELPIGNLIIDLDADIEKSNERLSSENESQFCSNNNSVTKSPSNSILGLFEKNSKTMSTSKLTRDVNNVPSNSNHQTNSTSNNTNSNLSSLNNKTNLIQSSNVDKGLKMKIKRKSIGGKSSESKLEIVQSDTIPRNNANFNLKSDKNGLNNSSNNSTNNSSTTNNSTKELNENCNNEKIKHSSNKNKNNSHKEKKEKKDKNSNGSLPINNKNDSNNSSSSNSILSSNTDNKDQRNHLAVPNFDKKISNQSQTINETSLSNNTSINSNTLNNNTQVKKDNNENTSDSPPHKKSKNEDTRVTQNSSINQSNNKSKPEMRSVSTLTSVGTITEPECLGFCEPGSTVCLEGIVWQENEGILVINVTWRGKTYVGTLLDCTRHDWAPPRLCDSPTSDLETKGLKSGRGKRTRSSISEVDSRLFQSKLRNGKGRRNNFTVPASPVKTDQNQGKRNGKNVNFKETDNKNLQTRKTPTPNSIDFTSTSSLNTPTSKKPNQLVLIECPEPNCSKKYKNMNGLKYHQEHVHSGTSYLKDDIDDSFKDSVVTTDTEDMDSESVANSPKQLNEICNENTSDYTSNHSKTFNGVNSTDDNVDKKSLTDCENQESLKIKREIENVLSPTACSDISDVNENSNETNEDTNFDKNTTSNNSDNKTPEPIKDDSNKQDLKLNNDKSKDQDSLKNENEFKDENKSNSFNFSSSEKNDFVSKNNQEKNLQDQLNANCQFQFNMMNNPHFPLPLGSLDPKIHALFMQNNFERHLAGQDRLLIDDSQKQLNKDLQQHTNLPVGLNNFNKNDNLHANEFKNTMDYKQQLSHKQMSISPNNRFSPQTLNQQQVQNSHAALFNQQNKSNSPYDFMHHDKQREELYKLSANRADERFMNTKNSMGNLSSPKQQLYNQSLKDENRLNSSNSKHSKDEPVKPTMESTGPPIHPSNSFYQMSSRFLGPQASVFPQGLQFDSGLYRHQTPFGNSPLNNNFMNNLRFPNSIPGQMPMELRPGLPGQEMGNNKLNNELNNHEAKKTIEMLKQVSQQYNFKELQDKVLMSPNSANKNSQNFGLGNSRQSSSQLNNVANLIRKEDNMSPQRHLHNHISHIGHHRDPYGALIQQATSNCVTPYSQK